MHKIRYLYKGRLPWSSHDQITNLIIQKQAKKVLDIGCYHGFIGQALREKNWKNNIVGLDKDFNCQIVTKNKKYNQFFHLDIEKNIKSIKDTFDAIILADVLEHLNNPLETLIKVTKLLKKDGLIYISVPNIANFFIRIQLLFGNFNYQNYGILDKDHRFFFTLSTIKKLISSANLKIIKTYCTPVPLPFLSKKKSLKKVLQYLYYLSKILLVIRREIFAYQFIFLCKVNKKQK